MSSLKIIDETITELESKRGTEISKIYNEMIVLINKFILNNWHKEHEAKIKIIDINQDTSILFDLKFDSENVIFEIDKYKRHHIGLKHNYMKYSANLLDGSICYTPSSKKLKLEENRFLIMTLLNELVRNISDILNTYNDLYNYPILENRQAAITVLCIYYYRESALKVFPKDMINLICKEILKWDY